MGRPSKIMLLSFGTRGDIQPYIAIACALQQSGYSISVCTNVDHKQFVEEFGLSFHHLHQDCQEVLKTPLLMEAQAKGDIRTFVDALGEVNVKEAPNVCERFITLTQKLNPDLILEGTLNSYLGRFAALKWDIPVMRVHLNATVYNPKRMSLGLPTLPCGLHKFFINALFDGSYKPFGPMDMAMEKQHAGTILDMWKRDDFVQDIMAPWDPLYICLSPSWKDVLYPYAHPNIKFVGGCVIKKESQIGQNFGDDDELLSLQGFLIAGPKPVYCGWGSMICNSKEFMIELVTRALMYCQQRAIVLSGWAELSMTSLKHATADTALLTYAEKNIFFAKKVPHEWLFPQMLCTVHHGGAGTVTSAMRAGVPTIITPVWIDQWDFSYLVNQLGVGIGFDKQFQKISAEELGNAISVVVKDSVMAAKAKKMGEILLEEDGTKKVVDAVQDFWNQWVESGEFHRHIAKLKMGKEQACQKLLHTILPCLCGARRRIDPKKQCVEKNSEFFLQEKIRRASMWMVSPVSEKKQLANEPQEIVQSQY